MLELVTRQLLMRESTADDLDALLPIYLSNPTFVEQNEGSEGSDLSPVGFLDFLEEHEDGYPWLGALVIENVSQRRGLGSEVFQGLVDYARREMSWSILRAGVKAVNEGGLALLTHVGFQIAEERSERFAGGLQRFILMEYALMGS
jgi:RimJ/RimL family protein N-acetyltransferase